MDDLAQVFSKFEHRLRGWDVYSYTVELEPPFVSFGAYFKPPPPAVDDGRQETLLSSMVGIIKPKEATGGIEGIR